MSHRYDIRIKVVSQKGFCARGHVVGDEFMLSQTTPEGLCPSAFNSLFPFAQTLRFGGSFPWEKNPDLTEIACPDAKNPVTFELYRLPAID